MDYLQQNHISVLISDHQTINLWKKSNTVDP